MAQEQNISVEAAWQALKGLADDLEATHAPPFAIAFFEDHWDVICRVIDEMANAAWHAHS